MPTAEQINMGIEAKIHELDEKRAHLMEGGGKERIEKQHQSGKLTARERIDRLIDGGSFQEIGLFAKHHATLFGMADKELPADGVVTGAATVDGRLIHLASQDFTVGGGAAGEVHSDKVAEMMRYSLKTGSPFVFINDSGGARVQEGINSLAGYGRVFYMNVMLSGVVPQVSLICGPCAGGAAYSPALTDFIIQTKGAQMFITGPSVIKQVTGEVVTPEQLGGPAAQMTYSGVVHFIAENDDEAAFICRRLLSFLPSNNLEDPPRPAVRRTARSRSGAEPPGSRRWQGRLRHAHRDRRAARPGRFSGSAVELRAEHPDRLRPHRGPHRGSHRQSALGAGGRAGYQRFRQSRALHPLLQCLQYSAADPGGCARLHARRAAGVRRHHPARREAAVRLLGSHGAEGHGDRAQGLRRRVPGDVRQGSGRGSGGRLAHRAKSP